ncbi:hypothetical protein Ctob_010209 [Chrysochromulina tobinii]|uniref:Secreted protein n=1 Tax=Chrysochromulina tobinii TaxID=1460289 RepID=A0A0M0JWJ7_9EUKA|nr:hypothetical protein Ctob_010209 [Chrysochromulina tobinii]|eukprot:KOO30697.1 hypothetical protein Ctob_010209 [Chrysochromulina sp. CCMP291]
MMTSLWALVFSLSISSLPARQSNMHQFWPRRCDFGLARRTRFPDFDRLVLRSGHNLGPVRGKRDRPDQAAVGIGLLAQQLQFVCQTSQHASVLAKEGRFEGSGAPESQTLIVLSNDPDKILVPSGENATEMMVLLWAFVFSLSISSFPARQSNMHQFWPRRGDFELARRTRIPDFDRPVNRSGHNLGPVRGKRHRRDGLAVRVRLLAQHLQLSCQAIQHASDLAKEGRF